MIEFNGLPSDVHYCTSHRDGDWIIWICPFCSDPANLLFSDYERRMNWKTGKWKSKGVTDIRHAGFHDDSKKTVSIPLTKNLEEN